MDRLKQSKRQAETQQVVAEFKGNPEVFHAFMNVRKSIESTSSAERGCVAMFMSKPEKGCLLFRPKSWSTYTFILGIEYNSIW